MARRKLLSAGSCVLRVYRGERSLLMITIPENVIERLRVKEDDLLFWEDYTTTRGGEPVIRLRLFRRRRRKKPNPSTMPRIILSLEWS
ncbi:hypothetical protein J7L00_07575 [Candidatus Bathyarchaeota archaeon]|nr:hypothetical protein [Candidatus Bathyarchaeota archaeon]